jgi:hypothetical protein
LRERERIDWMERLGYATKDPVLCVQALGASLERPWWTLDFLQRRYDCLRAAQHPLLGRAEQDLVDYLMATTGSFGSEQELAQTSDEQ